MNKNLFSKISLLVAVIIMVTACGPKPADNTLNVWITWGDERLSGDCHCTG
jgi:hypothetical protein